MTDIPGSGGSGGYVAPIGCVGPTGCVGSTGCVGTPGFKGPDWPIDSLLNLLKSVDKNTKCVIQMEDGSLFFYNPPNDANANMDADKDETNESDID